MNNINNKRIKTKYTKLILIFLELGARVPRAAAGLHEEVSDWTQQ